MCDYIVHLTKLKCLFICDAFFGAIFPIDRKRREEREESWKKKKEKKKDSQTARNVLRVGINLRISMDDRSATGPSALKHLGGCALIVLLTLIVIKRAGNGLAAVSYILRRGCDPFVY